MKSKGYIVLGYKKRTNKIIGEVENSFSLGFSMELVRIYRSKLHYGNQLLYNNLQKNCKGYNKRYKYKFNVFRIGTDYCPVKLDWTYADYDRGNTKWSKYNWINLPFKVKENINLESIFKI